MRLYYRNRNHPQIPQAGKWFISWAYEIFTAEHTESAEFFAPIFLRGLCGEKEIGPLFYPLPVIGDLDVHIGKYSGSIDGRRDSIRAPARWICAVFCLWALLLDPRWPARHLPGAI